MHSIRILYFSLILLFCQSLYASEQHEFSVDIQGLKYEVVVTENMKLASKVSGIDEALRGAHYIGVVKGEDGSWVRASYIDGQWQGVVSIHNGMHILEQTTAPLPGTATATQTLMNSTPMTEVDGLEGTCGRGDGTDTMLDHVAQLSATSGASSSTSTPSPLSATFAQFCSQEVNGICVIAEVEIAFDIPFQDVFGAQATAQAISILNIVDGHYLNDLKISIDAITVEMLANDLFNTSVVASPVLDAGDLLDEIEAKKNNAQIPFITNNNALTHVVTGRDFNGGTLGVAYLASVCVANGFSTGTSSIFFNNPTTPNIALTAVIVAHELAHNLGADHDGPGANALCPNATFIMSPSINPVFNLTNFSSCSTMDIETTLSNLVTPELCMDFPADVFITENAGNNGALNPNLEFSSTYTATLLNGFKVVDRVNISGSIDAEEGMFIGVAANGANCNIAVGGASYTCTVSNPPSSFPMEANVRVVANVTDVTITQSIDEDTADVQEVNAANNTLASSFNIIDNNVISNVPVTPNSPTTPNTNVNNAAEEESGGAGSHSIGFMLLMFGLYVYSKGRT